MATATSNSKTDQLAATERPKHAVRMILIINATAYEIVPIKVEAEVVRQCFELRKPDGEVWHVSQHDHGTQCTCADFEFNRNYLDPLGCKHIRALTAMGVVDTRPARVRTPPPSAFNEEQESKAMAKDWSDNIRYGIRRR
ncbi:SWIM zinc finger [Singulisphaera sp. GP187]|uniref:SWIM zinc finger family protein n=1 Tax=Singulisphaera sp. GP187 TaxID=1882752 RepID=UPI00092A1231|nr:SWIM zinc finger family protein [Singulisphaera sp. GP187]SIN69270.1 SWIM zinc finger [Singulisphaera sp. GP187]